MFSDKKILIFFFFYISVRLWVFVRTACNGYLQSIFFSRNKKNNVYSCKPQFYYIKVGFKGVKIIYRYVFVMVGKQIGHETVVTLVKMAEKAPSASSPIKLTIFSSQHFDIYIQQITFSIGKERTQSAMAAMRASHKSCLH